ncbi:hypothetical protein IAF10_19545, partial [Acinetobacter baumannii]|nr:hypothetical protein [Acinetobacter baumannii]MBD0176116.1 hypothetical protein [Acinetobacter baumannii]
SMFFGELIIVESGKAQAVLKIDSDDATEFPIKTYLTDDLPDEIEIVLAGVDSSFCLTVGFGASFNINALFSGNALAASPK